MKRSFTDRIFGGVCGGLAESWHISAWILRLLFVVLTVLTLGAFAVLYLLLWWILPQDSLVVPRQSSVLRGLLVLALIVAVGGGYVLRYLGYTTSPTGQDLYIPALLLLTVVVFTLQQVRR